MKFSLILWVLVIVTYCDGGLIGDFIAGAHNTAGSIVSGIAGGIQFGLTGGGGHQRHPPHNKPHRPGNQETVIVVVEDTDPERPGYNGEGQYNQNGYGNFNRPHNGPGQNQKPNKYGNGNGYGNQQSNNFNYNQGNGNGQYGVKPNYQFPQNPNNQQINPNHQQFNPQNHYNNQNNQHGRPNHNNNQQNNQFGNPNNEQGNLYNQNENSNNQGNQNGQYGNTNNNRPNNPNNQNGNFNNRPVNPNNQYGNPNNQYENVNNQNENKNPNGNINRPAYSTENPYQNQPNYQEQTTNGGQVKPVVVDTSKKLPGESNNKVEKTTIDPTGVDAYPLFIPLNPNQYHYGGDKVDVNAPKREVDNSKSKPAEEEDFPIDIRMDKLDNP